METQRNPPIDLDAQAWRHLIQTLLALLPPPIQDIPEATETRNHAAIARIAAMAPVNANEAELAAQCVLARAQAEDLMRLIREQQQRRKRETNHKDADQDEWARHIAAQSMLDALPEEPKTELESHTAGNETSTGQSPSPIAPNAPPPALVPLTEPPPPGT